MAIQYDKDNIFAKILRGEVPCHRVYEDDYTLAFMDVMPQAKGHVLVIPKCQATELSDMTSEYIMAVFETAKKVMAAQRHVLQRDGIIQLQLNGEQAGQSVFHYHIHLIPGHIHALDKHEEYQADQAELANLAAQLHDYLSE